VTLALRWYALAYIVGIVIGWRISVAALRRPHLWAGTQPPMTPAQLESLLTWIILGIIAGGRLGYVLFYSPATSSRTRGRSRPFGRAACPSMAVSWA
jgi:phosphatidylglycerol:prolipoprotein diacylglycerol transferase